MANSYGPLVEGKVVSSNGIALQPGTEPGNSQSPTPGQLSAMGYARADVAAGVVLIEVVPSGCKPAECSVTVTAISQGEKLSETIGLK